MQDSSTYMVQHMPEMAFLQRYSNQGNLSMLFPSYYAPALDEQKPQEHWQITYFSALLFIA